MTKVTKKAEFGKKDHHVVETLMGIIKTDYSIVLELFKEQKADIDAMPKGKERNFLQRDYDDWVKTVANHIETKTEMMHRMGKHEDPISYVFTEAEIAFVYEKVKDIDFDAGGDSAMPGPR